MCGIAGFLTTDGRTPDRSLLVGMCDRLAHRGPDGEGYFIGAPVALGHRRLSIIDVEGGAQPLGNEDDSVQIVFNGEIYNFQELMDGLKQRGHHFRTRSDTEVIVHLYEEVGERVPEYLNGMFAFAIWDARRRRLFLARDRFGEKPLYFCESAPGFRFAFASELKALALLPGLALDVRPESVSQFLSLSYIPDPSTIYKQIHRLDPASSLSVPLEGAAVRSRYWTPSFDPDAAADPVRAAARLDELAANAVKIRMISEVPLGGFLSGGLDSSAVVAYMAAASAEPVRTFTIGFREKEYSEIEYARAVSSRVRSMHYEEIVDASLEKSLETLDLILDEPFGDSSIIPTLALARITRRHVTVALSGDGADEIFGGYRRYRFALYEEALRRRLPGWARRGLVGPLGRVYPRLDFAPRFLRARSTLRGIAAGLPGAYFQAMSRFSDEDLDGILAPGLRGFRVSDWFINKFEPYKDLPALTQLQAVDWETYLPGDILVKVDRATMAYSLESRAPWLDHRLAEFAASLPPEFHVSARDGKVLFRRAVAHHLPQITVNRPKMGFALPVREWLRSELVPVFESRVFRPEMGEYLNLPKVKEIWWEHRRGWRDRSAALWNIFSLACWDAARREPGGF